MRFHWETWFLSPEVRYLMFPRVFFKKMQGKAWVLYGGGNYYSASSMKRRALAYASVPRKFTRTWSLSLTLITG